MAQAIEVEIHDVVMIPRKAKLPMRCTNPKCGARLAKVGVHEVSWVDVGVHSWLVKGGIEGGGESKYGECYRTVAFECGACHEVLVGGLDARVAA